MIEGSCVCGAVHWTFAGETDGATACNCTACRKYGALWAYDYENEGVRPPARPRHLPEARHLSFIFAEHVAAWRFGVANSSMNTAAAALRSTCAWPNQTRSHTYRSITSTDWANSKTCHATIGVSPTTGSKAEAERVRPNSFIEGQATSSFACCCPFLVSKVGRHGFANEHVRTVWLAPFFAVWRDGCCCRSRCGRSIEAACKSCRCIRLPRPSVVGTLQRASGRVAA